MYQGVLLAHTAAVMLLVHTALDQAAHVYAAYHHITIHTKMQRTQSQQKDKRVSLCRITVSLQTINQPLD
jgi:hypothetical protein